MWFKKPSRTKPLVLHIDDSEDIVMYTSILLKGLGYDSLTCLNAHDGMKIAEEKQPDLILLDAQMPEMDGYKACWYLKENAKTKDIPILMATLEDEMKHVEKAMAFGAVGYVLKPLSRERLQVKIGEVLNAKKDA